jgi:AhpD family alkylhydroperoxidase
MQTPMQTPVQTAMETATETPITPRLNLFAAAPAPMRSWLDAGRAILAAALAAGLEPGLTELVKIRASQINRCAFCLQMHTEAARKAGETEARLYLLSAWRDSPLYSPRERAALAWTETLTRLAETGAPDAAYQALAAEFTAAEQVALSLLIVAINGWNRLQVGFRAVHPLAAGQAAPPKAAPPKPAPPKPAAREAA